MRSLGSLGIPIYGVDDDPASPVMKSCYLKQKFFITFDETKPQEYIEQILDIGRQIGTKTILIPTSDELAVFVTEYRNQLSRHFFFPDLDSDLAKGLISKQEMFTIATRHGIPTPFTLFPRNLNDVLNFVKNIRFPIMLKGIHGNRLMARTGHKMILVENRKELLEKYRQLEDPDSPNLMLQEHIPGGDDQVFIFNGYFNENSECLSAFTGHKIRQAPIHFGCASLGECRWNDDIANITKKFMKNIGYRGILDIGYRLDPRDGKYKVLDINPRVGGAFRLFVSKNDMDVVRSLYLDLTGQQQLSIVSREGRRWMIEDYDIISTYCYFREGSLKFKEWLRSFKGLEEGAWFNLKDPLPFLIMAARLCKRILKGLGKKSQFTSSVP